MKKLLFATSTFLLLSMQVMAQKYFDVYQNGKVTNSIATTDIDSVGLTGTTMQNRTVNFYRNGKATNSYLVSSVDSIKVFRTDEEQLVYLGIVGFNQELYEKPIDVLASSTSGFYTSFVQELSRKDGTLLYYAVDHALDMLKKTSFPTPLTSVNLVTFTDGLDQGSLMMNSNYSTDEQYLNAVNNRIGSTKIKGIPLTAYSLGLRGSDVTDYGLFQKNLNKLASTPEKAFEVNSMGAVRTRLQDICNQIISVSNRQTFSLKIPGQSNGTLIRFTFDNNTADNSTLYIEGTFNLANRSLTNIKYHGIKATSGSYVQGTQDGIFVTFTFTGMQREDGNGLIPNDYIREYYKTSGASVWQHNSEFTPSNNTKTTITHSGAAIMLVLDCSNSLGSQFSDMRSYAQDFIKRVAENTQEFNLEAPTNVTASLTDDLAVKMNWAAVKHAEYYVVYRNSTNNGTYKKVSPELTSTSWTDTEPLDGNNYYLVVAYGHGLQAYDWKTVVYVKKVKREDDWTKKGWKLLGIGLYTDDFVFPMYTEAGEPYTYEVEVLENTDTPGLYCIVNAYQPVAEAFGEEGGTENIVINAIDSEGVFIDLQPTGMDLGYGPQSIVTWGAYLMQNGATFDQMKAKGMLGTLKDGVITFPAFERKKADGTTAIYQALLFEDSGYYAGSNGAIKLVLPSAYTPEAKKKAAAHKKALDFERRLKGNVLIKNTNKKVSELLPPPKCIKNFVKGL